MITKLANLFIQRLASIPRSEALKTLGFSPTEEPNLAEITTAWKKAVMKHHPDRGGDLATMQLVNLSYDILKGKTRAAPEPSRSGPSSWSQPKAEPQKPSYSSDPWASPSQSRRDNTVPFNVVVPSPPTGVEWLFVTSPVTLRGRNYTSDEFESSVSAFALVGKTAEHVFIWCFAHRVHKQFFAGSKGDIDVWSFTNHKLPVMYLETLKFAKLVQDYVGQAVNAAVGNGMEAPTKIKGAYDASGLIGKPTLENLTRIRSKVIQPMADFLRPLTHRSTNKTQKSAPVTTVVKLQWVENSLTSHRELIVYVNNDKFPLSERDTLALYNKGFVHKVFGNYFYSGDTKLLNRLKNRAYAYRELSQVQSLPANIQRILADLADTQKS
jgi:hypothetical protein